MLKAGSHIRSLKLNNVIISWVRCHELNNYLPFFYVGPMFPNIDESLNQYNDLVKTAFIKRWSKHKCSKPGCSSVLVFDGGCKVRSTLHVSCLNHWFNKIKTQLRVVKFWWYEVWITSSDKLLDPVCDVLI